MQPSRAAVPGGLTEAKIEAVRRRIGIPAKHSAPPHNETCSSESFRHFAHGYGDDNPLYCDAAYAQETDWESLIAAPVYLSTTGVVRRRGLSKSEKAALSGGDPLAGLGQYMCGDRWVFLKPVRPGDQVRRAESLYSAELKESDFGGGVGALVTHQIAWDNDSEDPFGFRFLDFWHADRARSKSSGKYKEIDRASYSDADLDRIDAMYAAEGVRGSQTRTIDEVQVGDPVGPLVKGPYCLTDLIAWHVGTGLGTFGIGALKLGYKNRQRIPKFYSKNEMGHWESAQRCHWEDDYARELGQPAAYDYGIMRATWMTHLLTNWMGDGGWLWTLATSIRRFNYIGDVHVISGTVTGIDHERGIVAVEMVGENQRGETTCVGRAQVILPAPGLGHAIPPPYTAADIPEPFTPTKAATNSSTS